jgi:hypothetical protein
MYDFVGDVLSHFHKIPPTVFPFLPELYELGHVAGVDAHLCILQPCMQSSFVDTVLVLLAHNLSWSGRSKSETEKTSQPPDLIFHVRLCIVVLK